MATLITDDLEIHYVEHGPRDGTALVLVHGLFFSTRLFDRLASHLPERRIVALDVRGHGRSTRPRHAYHYSWSSLADDVVAVLDELGIDRAVVGGLSLGANTALAFGLDHPDRAAGLIVEMPVLVHSEPWARVVFGMMATGLRLGSPVLAPLTSVIRHTPLPPRPPELRMVRDVLGLRPLAAAALIEGLQASPLPGRDTALLAGLAVPTLVIGHHLDPVHAYDDAVWLADKVDDATLVSVQSILDFRLHTDRYAATIEAFLTEHGL